MRVLRNVVGICVAVALVGGYAASQAAYMQGAWAVYAARVDCAPVRILALCVLGAAVAMSLVKDEEREGEDR